MVAASILAHEGGWDEILLVAGPIVVVIGLLAVVKHRVDAQLPTDEDQDPGTR